MNLGQLQTQLQAIGYGGNTSAQQIAFINDAYREVCSSQRWPFLERQDVSTLIIPAGNNRIDMSGIANMLQVDAVRVFGADQLPLLPSPSNIEPQDMRDLEQASGNTIDVGPAHYWSMIANQIHVWPWADQNYNLRIDYIVAPPDLVSAGDVPVIPSAFHDVLVWGAARLMAIRERDIYTANFTNNQFQERYTKMQSAYMLRQRQTSSRVKQSGYWNTTLNYPIGNQGW